MANLSVKQGVAWRYLTDDTHTEVLYGGAAGGGKSSLGCLWLMTNAIKYQGSRWLMGRAVLKTLKETTLNTFFDESAKEGLKAGRDYIYNGQTNTIHIGASQILLKDLFAYPSDPNFDELGSLELTGAFIDEANQVTPKAKAIVGSRIRYKLDEFGLMPKLLMTCNPAKNWVRKDFYDPWKAKTLKRGRAFVQALVMDNPAFAPDPLTGEPHPYVNKLMELEGADRQRLLIGNWDYDDDPAALMGFDAINDLWTNEHVPGGDRYITADVARYGSDLTVIAVWDGLRVVHLESHEKTSVPESASHILALCASHSVPRSRVVVDDDGIGGGVVDLIQGCRPFKGGSTPIETKGQAQNYANLKAQCSYTLAQKVNAGELFIGPTDHRDRIAEELAWIKRADMDKDGKLRILGKDKIREGIGRSPDFADVLMMRMLFELRQSMDVVGYLSAQGKQYKRDVVRQAISEHYKGYKR